MILPKAHSMRLDGKRALVAGASSGIRLACAAAMVTSTSVMIDGGWTAE